MCVNLCVLGVMVLDADTICCPCNFKIAPIYWDLLTSIPFKLATLTFKALHTGRPPYLSDLLQHHQPTRFLHSSSSHQLSVPRHNLTVGSRALRFSTPRVWNSLPVSIRESQSLPTFGRLLKTSKDRQPNPSQLPILPRISSSTRPNSSKTLALHKPCRPTYLLACKAITVLYCVLSRCSSRTQTVTLGTSCVWVLCSTQTFAFYLTRLLSNLRPTTHECLHLVMCGHFQSHDKDSSHAIRSAIFKNPMLHPKCMAPCFMEPKLLLIEVIHCSNRNFRPFCSDLDLDHMTFIYEPDKQKYALASFFGPPSRWNVLSQN